MKTRIKNLFRVSALLAGLGLLLADRVTAQNFADWPVTRIAADGSHSLFTRADGTLFVMGDNTYGQLGLGPSVTNVNAPTALTNGIGPIAAGYEHSLMFSGRGLWAMGYNNHGQLGDGTINNHYFPEQVYSVVPTSEFNALSAGGYHSLFGVTSLTGLGGGGLWAMGDNAYGQLGDGSYNDHQTPEEVVSYSSGQPKVRASAAGFYHSLFIKSDGSVWGMGDNVDGQLGGGVSDSTNILTQLFNNVYGTATATAIAAGYYHSLFITSDGILWAVGADQFGQLGDRMERYSIVNVYPMEAAGPETETGFSNVVIVAAAGSVHSLLIMSDGSLWAMGDNLDGQLGVSGFNGYTDYPHMIVASNVVAVAAGGFHSLFIKSDGSLWGMGYNASGQLGTGDYTDRYTPVEIVAPPTQIIIIPYSSNVILAWPSNAAAFVLQSTTNLASPAWTTVSPGPVLVGDQFEAIPPSSGTQKFYRLMLSQ